MNAHVALIEDDLNLARVVEIELQHEGYHVSVAHDGTSGLALVQNAQPDLLILDWILPTLAGIEVCQRLRSAGSKIPIIMLTAKDEIADRVAGLDAGADDYIVKPFEVEELLARVRAYLRRISYGGSGVLQFADLCLNPGTHEVFRGPRPIELPAKEFKLLEYLMIHPRQIVSRGQLFDYVWGDGFTGNSNVLEVYIRQLRLKLEANHERRLIYTVRNMGYVLQDQPF
ncbi:DNA-binding response regulator [filamentous cyanobacterium CCP1]|nr:DNA-binding response regulator [filamentous cyanobacterium CCP2]PSB61636.1 DNA-binding response regulator [filamentous cyanobacterium CCP1]